MSNPNYQLPKKLPSRFTVEFEEFKTLTFKERLQILLGYNLRVCSKVMVDRRNESVKAGSTVWLTKETTAQGVINEQVTESL